MRRATRSGRQGRRITSSTTFAGGGSTSVSFTFPAATLFPINDQHLRNAMLGSNMSRAWISFIQGSTRYAFDATHEGSGANCVTWNTALAGATRAQVSLTAGARTGTQNATQFETAIVAAGVTGVSRVGATVTIANASGRLVGAAATYDTSLRGIWGSQRDRFGTASTANANGNMGGTGSSHLVGPASAGRIIGVYMRAGGTANVRLGIANGPAYSTTPTAFSGGTEALGTRGAVDTTLVAAIFSEPMAMSAAASLWWSFRGAGGGDPTLRYRNHGSTPEGNGDSVVSRQLLFSTTTSNPATAIYTAGAYTHGAEAGPYNIYAFGGFIYEIPVAGAYVGDGGIYVGVGTHTTAAAGSPTATIATDMDAETFGMRHPIPWDCSLVAVDVSMAAHSASEDLGFCVYAFGDVVAPSVLGATLLRSIGRYGVAGTGYQRHTLSTPLSLTAGQICAVYWNAGNIDGVTPTNTISVYYDPDTGGSEYWSTAWIDNGREWNDMDPYGGGGYGQQTEYRTRAAFGGDMPEADPNVTWPSTLLVDPSDDNSVRNHLRHRIYLYRQGIS